MKGIAGSGSVVRAELIGLAASPGAASGDPDPLDAARTVRRALADGKLKALEVALIVVSAGLASGEQPHADFVRLALGPHGTQVPSARAADAQVIGIAAAGVMEIPGVAIAVLYESGRTLALCLRRASASGGQSFVK